MHKEILDERQVQILHLLWYAKKRGFYLVWGTAIALHIGHRKSIDFDLFRGTDFTQWEIDRILKNAHVYWEKKFISRAENHTWKIQWVNITFFSFPFEVPATIPFEKYIDLPDLLSLAAMKAYALGHRSKWKDYVDLYFILKYHFSIDDVSERAREIFGGGFNLALFLEQLTYHEDMNYTESVEYLIPDPPSDEEVKAFLIEKAIED
jgi:hypothetical protein